MTTFESTPKITPYSQEIVFDALSDFNHFGDLIPDGKVKSWQSTGDTCRFTVDGMGELGLRIAERQQFELIRYTGDGKVPFLFNLTVRLAAREQGTEVVLALAASLNPMMKLIAEGPIAKFLDLVSDAIVNHRF
jgi:hypothetical protein